MRGRYPKPAHLRQNRTVKAGRATLEADASGTVPDIPNPDGRTWHPLTLATWERAWQSPMAPQWIASDVDGLGRLAILWDMFYTTGDRRIAAEIRLQESRFGLSPLDRSRLQWEVARSEGAQRHRAPTRAPGASDPRRFLLGLD